MANEPNGGKRSPHLERLKRQNSAATVKLYITLIILGAVVGLAYVKRVEIIAVYNSVMNPPPAVAPAPVQPIPETKAADAKPAPEPARKIQVPPVEPAKPPAKVVVEPAISPKDEAAARVLLQDGKGLLEKFDFSGASKKFNEAAAMRLGRELKEEAKKWGVKAVEYQNATKHIAVADYAKGENAVVIETTDGSEWRGLKVKDDNDTIYLQVVNADNPAAEGIQKFPIPRSEIKSITPISLEKRRVEFGDMLLAAESARSISHSTDYYDLVYLARRLGLGKQCMMYLDRAFDGGPGHDPDPNVGDSFRRVVLFRAIGRATLLMAGNRRTQVEIELKKLRDTLPGFAPVDDEIAAFRSQVMDTVKPGFQPSIVVNEKNADLKKPSPSSAGADKSKMLARDDSIQIGTDNKVLATGPAAKVVDRGNLKFDEAMNMVRKYQIGVGGNKNENNRILTLARDLFRECIDIYEEAIKLEPANRAIRDRQQTANQMVYFCNKNLII